jgi:hypothetical protein
MIATPKKFPSPSLCVLYEAHRVNPSIVSSGLKAIFYRKYLELSYCYPSANLRSELFGTGETDSEEFDYSADADNGSSYPPALDQIIQLTE